ncbi:MAG: hypothetical protein ACTSVI_01390 [Promethearchaeota archaeon]
MVMVDNFGSIIFLWSYMVIVWFVVIRLWFKRPTNPSKEWKALFMAFFLLAFGDSFHLLPRTYLWYRYTFENALDIYTSAIGVIVYGVGLIFTGITMTFFYLMFYYFWKELYLERNDIPGLDGIKKHVKIHDVIAHLSVISRIFLILLPWNNWGGEPEYCCTFLSFRLVTNIPLYVIGLQVVYLFIRSLLIKDINEKVPGKVSKAVKNSSIWIIVSYTCYTITLIGVAFYPLFGMFMIPKTVAYIVVVYYMYKYVLSDKELTTISSKATIEKKS